jgi:hypothetical protein
MVPFDPRDWMGGQGWWRECDQNRRKPEEISREVMHRWLASLALCLCFALLGPVDHLPLSLAGLLLIAAIASIGLALVRGESPFSRHLTAWDEAALSLTVSLGLWLWFRGGGAGLH